MAGRGEGRLACLWPHNMALPSGRVFLRPKRQLQRFTKRLGYIVFPHCQQLADSMVAGPKQHNILNPESPLRGDPPSKENASWKN